MKKVDINNEENTEGHAVSSCAEMQLQITRFLKSDKWKDQLKSFIPVIFCILGMICFEIIQLGDYSMLQSL